MTILRFKELNRILKMSSIKCPYCPRTFSSKSGYTKHVNNCFSSADSDGDELNLITDISNMLLDSKKIIRDIEEVKRNIK